MRTLLERLELLPHQRFALAELRLLEQRMSRDAVPLDPARPAFLARAPGRLDLMGGIADYSGSVVLELPLGEATWVLVQPTAEAALSVVSLGDRSEQTRRFAIPCAELSDGLLADEARARRTFAENPEHHFAAYALGVLVTARVLGRLRGLSGLRVVICSEVPEGKGISSSAALEVATAMALFACAGEQIEGPTLAALAQRAENLVAGAPSGIMDQMTCACGEAGQLLRLRCQPADIEGSVSLPPELVVFGLDSGVRHAVGQSDYGSVRAAAFMGYTIIARALGFPMREVERGRVVIDDLVYQGYLARIPVSVFAERFAPMLPEQLSGADFLERFGGSPDSVTRVEPGRTYAIRACTQHPVFEDHRVRLFAAQLPHAHTEESRALLGELMFQSHQSYTAVGLGSAATDALVEEVRALGPERGWYGAKITGGGSGGTVAVLVRRGATPSIEEFCQRQMARLGSVARSFSGTSPGAVAYGTLKLRETT